MTSYFNTILPNDFDCLVHLHNTYEGYSGFFYNLKFMGSSKPLAGLGRFYAKTLR